jgi:hypothetical protein
MEKNPVCMEKNPVKMEIFFAWIQGLAMNTFALEPRSTWWKCAGILMTALPSLSIKNTTLYHKG